VNLLWTPHNLASRSALRAQIPTWPATGRINSWRLRTQSRSHFHIGVPLMLAFDEYFTRSRARCLSFSLSLSLSRAVSRSRSLSRSRALSLVLALSLALARCLSFSLPLALSRSLSRSLGHACYETHGWLDHDLHTR